MAELGTAVPTEASPVFRFPCHCWRRSSMGSMKTYFLIAGAGLVVCVMTAIIVMQMKLQISPD
jgi:hypothetical protein